MRVRCEVRRRLVGAAGGLLLALVLACGSDPDTAGPSLEDCEIPPDAGTVVGIRNFVFFPDTVRVSAGARVTWVNCEPPAIDAHTSTSDDGLWDSPFLTAGQSFSRVFGVPGEFGYFCIPHPFMRGVVIVE
jgi:plastocyanin